jgi:hypothetical protein
MTQVLKRMQSYCTTVVQKVWSGRDTSSEEETVSQTHDPERRQEARTAWTRSCEFGLWHLITEDAAVIEEGEGVTINHSTTGMLLVVGIAPSKGQLLEIRMAQPSLRRSISLVEVSWTKPVRKESEGHLFLVGCRLMFGPSHYWAF